MLLVGRMGLDKKSDLSLRLVTNISMFVNVASLAATVTFALHFNSAMFVLQPHVTDFVLIAVDWLFVK